MKVIFAGGGTGGHLYPAVAIAEVLKSKGVDVEFYVSNRGIDARILKKTGYKYTEQNVSAFKGKGLLSKFVALYKLAAATVRIYPQIKRGDKVLLMGGFASAPSAVVAKIKGAELYLHEQNSVMGLVNRVFAGMCTKVFLSFGDTKDAKGNTIVTGNPVRRAFHNAEKKNDYKGNLLILGGSQGSRAVNKLIASSATNLVDAGFTITHQTGEGLYKETLDMYGVLVKKYANNIVVKPYIDNVAEAMSNADIAIARSGSGTVFELEALECPCIYVPFKQASDNHQYYNALSAVNGNRASMLVEDEATVEQLMATLNNMKENYETYKQALKDNNKLNSAKVIAKEMGIE